MKWMTWMKWGQSVPHGESSKHGCISGGSRLVKPYHWDVFALIREPFMHVNGSLFCQDATYINLFRRFEQLFIFTPYFGKTTCLAHVFGWVVEPPPRNISIWDTNIMHQNALSAHMNIQQLGETSTLTRTNNSCCCSWLYLLSLLLLWLWLWLLLLLSLLLLLLLLDQRNLACPCCHFGSTPWTSHLRQPIQRLRINSYIAT